MAINGGMPNMFRPMAVECCWACKCHGCHGLTPRDHHCARHCLTFELKGEPLEDLGRYMGSKYGKIKNHCSFCREYEDWPWQKTWVFLGKKSVTRLSSVDRSTSRPVVHLGWKRGRGVETRRPPDEEATEDEPLSWNQSQCHLENHRISLVFFPWIFQHAMFESLIFSSMPCFAPSKSLGGLRCWHLTPRSECLGPGKSWEDRIWMDMGHMGMVKNHEEPMLHWWPWWTPSNGYLKWMHMDLSHGRKLDYSMYPYNGHTTICKKW